MTLAELRAAMADALTRWTSTLTELEAADESNHADRLAAVETAATEHATATEAYARRKTLEEARALLPVAIIEPDPPEERTPGTPGTPRVRVVSEPLTYERHAPHSIFRDMAELKSNQSPAAAERLHRHAQEMVVERPAEQRALSQTAGAGGDFIPPLWLVDEWIGVPRAGRPIADSLHHIDLPAHTNSINLPKVSTGAAVAVQSDGGAVQSTDLTTTFVTGAVQTVAGQQDASQQLVDLSAPGIDEVIWNDISQDYDTKIDVAVINGTVTNAKGLLQVASVNTATYTDASPTAGELYPKAANVVGLIHNLRFLPPQVIAMTPLRWAWMLSQVDANNRPIVLPLGYPGYNPLAMADKVASESLVGNWLGLPVIADASIPQTLGAGTEDAILTYRADDLYLYESPTPRLRVLEEVLSGTLQVRFQIYNYYAILAGRLPKSIGKVTGTGLIAPSF